MSLYTKQADVITIALGPLYTSSLVTESVRNGFEKFVCKLTGFIDTTVAVSSFTLTILAVERYHALLKPLNINARLQLNEDNIKQVLAVIWISSFLISLPNIIFFEWRESLT